jgi:hypothetical protein
MKPAVSIPPNTDLNQIAKILFQSPQKVSERPNSAKFKEMLRASKIDPNKPLEKPPVCLASFGLDSEGIYCTLGNFSLVIGKAKSKKTFSVSLFLACLVANKAVFGKFKGALPTAKTRVIFFDTEQSEYHVQKVYHRICDLLEVKNPINFDTHYLRQYTPSERLGIIDEAINTIPDLGFVAIDGIRDLVTSINSEEEATKIASYLLKWTQEKGIHIITVLHQNKGDLNARGHLGTELINKAETVLSVSLDPSDKNISVVETEFSRDRSPETFAFMVNENGLPEILEDWIPQSSGTKKAPKEPTPEELRETILDVFKNHNKPKAKDIKKGIKERFSLPDSMVNSLKTEMETRGWITPNTPNQNDPNRYYQWTASDS